MTSVGLTSLIWEDSSLKPYLGGPDMERFLNSRELKTIIASKKPALVLFSGPWCIDCRNFQSTWDEWTRDRKGPIHTLVVERGSPEWSEWSLDEIPTVAAFDRGNELDREHGDIGKQDLDRLWKAIMRT